jgi:hypothetical protein
MVASSNLGSQVRRLQFLDDIFQRLSVNTARRKTDTHLLQAGKQQSPFGSSFVGSFAWEL